MKKLVLNISYIFIIVFLISCSKENIIVSTEGKADYFPMQVGNSWTYSFNDAEWNVQITATKIMGGNLYFLFVRNFGGEIDTTYFRKVENVIYINYLGADYIYIDFNKATGEEWQSYENFYVKINKMNMNVEVAAGNFNNVIEILLENSSVSDLFEFNRYAPNIGLIESIGFRRKSELKFAFVNGILYP